MLTPQIERYLIIDSIFRNSPDGVNLESLLERLNASLSEERKIKRRQLQADLNVLREEYGAPIPNKHGIRVFRYCNPDYSLASIILSEVSMASRTQD